LAEKCEDAQSEVSEWGAAGEGRNARGEAGVEEKGEDVGEQGGNGGGAGVVPSAGLG